MSNELEAVSNERCKVQLKWHKPADYGGCPVLRYIVEQMHRCSEEGRFIEYLVTVEEHPRF